jgi:hypothetical protein
VGSLSLEVKWPGHEADNSPPSSAEVKNARSYTSTPNTPSWRCARLKYRDKFSVWSVYTGSDTTDNMFREEGHVARMASERNACKRRET